MQNKSKPFFPLTTFDESEGKLIQKTEQGATKHEQTATLLLASMLENPNTKTYHNPQLAKDAYYLAEELLNLFETDEVMDEMTDLQYKDFIASIILTGEQSKPTFRLFGYNKLVAFNAGYKSISVNGVTYHIKII